MIPLFSYFFMFIWLEGRKKLKPNFSGLVGNLNTSRKNRVIHRVERKCKLGHLWYKLSECYCVQKVDRIILENK